MAYRQAYHGQVQLLVSVLPFVAQESCFALKGGTAINLFVLNAPRLSIDIDLTYLPLEPRNEALPNARTALQRIAERIGNVAGTHADLNTNRGEGLLLNIQRGSFRIKIEVNPTLRGSIKRAETREICTYAEEKFGYARMAVLDHADLYGGKICAALDRQHPRDLFDIKCLLDENRLTRDVVAGFLVYLISHNRPIREILAPRFADIRPSFVDHFQGMTREPVQVEALEQAREGLLARLRDMLTPADCSFLVSLKQGEPCWSHLPYAHVRNLPGVRWKLRNIRAMRPDTWKRNVAALEQVLSEHYNYSKTI